ncbi:jg3302 [Pararge aegeria aegeria]|uniref:Jg3302 protein n=1 Tax=Pararge aegeria aegeria TaxID=348720 RepID=A0A8S4RSG7_9NEOP|nr:jg3302 [Pararge aegeria aegeria]
MGLIVKERERYLCSRYSYLSVINYMKERRRFVNNKSDQHSSTNWETEVTSHGVGLAQRTDWRWGKSPEVVTARWATCSTNFK